MVKETLFRKVEEILGKETRLIHLPPRGRVVFVGDTHGDLDATREVVRRYLKEPYRIVFLGDYVDRGNQSEENIHFLLDSNANIRRTSSCWQEITKGLW